MITAPQVIPCRTMGEWVVHTGQPHKPPYGQRSPFSDIAVEATFKSPSGQVLTMPGFHDGEDVWRVRFNPGETGSWQYLIASRPVDEAFDHEGSFEVTPRRTRGFLKATPGRGWGFSFESGEPVFLFGDTVYNLAAMALCGGEVQGFLKRRAAQGFNVLRIRVPVSPFHRPDGYSEWQTQRTWAWGGSEQAPRFDLFNLEWFRVVDQVVQWCEELDLGIEMIMEGWGFEFPFNNRLFFTNEWEELWMRYLIARYDAFNCLYIWTPLNEYEYYPNGDWNYKATADRWALRVARWIKSVAPHGHPIAMHNGPRLPPFAERFHADPEAVDAIMYQDWGTRDAERGWLAAGIEDGIQQAFHGWRGSAVLAEWGYERNPDFALNLPHHEHCDRDHTRRGAWRGAFCGLGIIHGFENSWGPWMLLDEDQPGMADLLLVRDFFTKEVPFARLRPSPDLITDGPTEAGHRPLALATEERDLIAAYLPTGGIVGLALQQDRMYQAEWFDPRSGERIAGTAAEAGQFEAPGGASAEGNPFDWILLVTGTVSR
jgi:hypothetical protein